MSTPKDIEVLVERLKLLGQENYEMLGNIHEPLFEAATALTSLKEERDRFQTALKVISQKEGVPGDIALQALQEQSK